MRALQVIENEMRTAARPWRTLFLWSIGAIRSSGKTDQGMVERADVLRLLGCRRKCFPKEEVAVVRFAIAGTPAPNSPHAKPTPGHSIPDLSLGFPQPAHKNKPVRERLKPGRLSSL